MVFYNNIKLRLTAESNINNNINININIIAGCINKKNEILIR